MKTLGGVFLAVAFLVADAMAAQEPFALQFVPVVNTGSHLDVKVQIKATGSPFSVGTCNLVFGHNAGIENPVLVFAHNFSGVDSYEPLTVTTPAPGLASINIEYIGSLGSGGIVPQRYVDVATVRFAITDTGQAVSFVPQVGSLSPQTLVYQSDESTRNSISTDIRADMKVYLEGPYNIGLAAMTKQLNSGGHLAIRYSGALIPADAVDSISIEIRNSPSGIASTVRKFRAAWLLTDGSIRDFADTTQRYVAFDTTDANYYLVVRHGNHLGVMSSAAQALNALTVNRYDFTSAQSQAWGTDPMKQVQTGVFALFGGDGNQSGVVTAADANGAFGALNTTGYNLFDVNLTGVVTAADANFVFGNLNKTSQVPQ